MAHFTIRFMQRIMKASNVSNGKRETQEKKNGRRVTVDGWRKDLLETAGRFQDHPAKHIGVEDRVGSLEEGKDADIVICDGNPLKIETSVMVTIINGKVVWTKEKR